MSSESATDPQSQITLSREIDAPVSDVFAAFTDAALIEQWLADEAESEPFEGGRYSLRSLAEGDDEADLFVSGEFVEFVEDRRLALSWVVENAGEDGGEAIFFVEIDFAALDAERTRVTLVERGSAHADPQSRIFSMEAWDAAIAHLAELIG